MQDTTNLVRGLEGPTIDTVVRGVNVPFREPRDVAVLKASRADSVERAVPMKGFPGHLNAHISTSFQAFPVVWLTLAHHLSAAGPTVSA